MTDKRALCDCIVLEDFLQECVTSDNTILFRYLALEIASGNRNRGSVFPVNNVPEFSETYSPAQQLELEKPCSGLLLPKRILPIPFLRALGDVAQQVKMIHNLSRKAHL